MKIRTVARYTAVVLGTLSLVFLVWVFRQVIILFIFSLAFAAAARPSVEALTRRGVQRTLALLLVYIAFIGLIIFLFFFLGGALLRELQQLADNLARTYDRAWTEWPNGTDIQQAVIRQMPAPAELYESFSPEQQNSALQALLGVTAVSANFLAQVVTILILSIYWSIDRVHFERLWMSLLPVESRARARDIWRNIENDFGAYVRSEVFQSILASLLLGFGLWAMGIQYSILLAVLAGIAWLIPWLGGVLVVLVISLAAFTQSLWLGIMAFVLTVGVLFFLEFFIEPRFFHSRQFSSLLSILLMIALVEPFGLLGFIIAPPLAAALELIIRYNLAARPLTVATETAQRLAALREKIQSIREDVSSREKGLEPQTVNMLTRLESLVEKADDLLDRESPPDRTSRTNRLQA